MDRAHIIMKDNTVILCKIKCIMNRMVEAEELSLVFIPINGSQNNFEAMLQDGIKTWGSSLINVDEVKSIHYVDEEKWTKYHKEIQEEMAKHGQFNQLIEQDIGSINMEPENVLYDPKLIIHVSPDLAPESDHAKLMIFQVKDDATIILAKIEPLKISKSKGD